MSSFSLDNFEESDYMDEDDVSEYRPDSYDIYINEDNIDW